MQQHSAPPRLHSNRTYPLLLALMLLCSACASQPQLVALVDGRYVVSTAAMTGASGMGKLRAEALQLASEQCRKLRMEPQVESQQESGRWYVPGNYRRLEITFRCVPGTAS